MIYKFNSSNHSVSRRNSPFIIPQLTSAVIFASPYMVQIKEKGPGQAPIKIRTADMFSQTTPLVAIQNAGGIMQTAFKFPGSVSTQPDWAIPLNFRLHHAIPLDQEERAKAVAGVTRTVLEGIISGAKSDDLRVSTDCDVD